MPLYLSPVCNDQTFDANGDPLSGGQIETYLAGSSTPAATYTDNTGLVPQSNPIILNTLGYPTLGPIWLTGGLAYKLIIKNASGSTLRTIDNIAGVNDASVSQSEWVESGFTPTYINATSFSVPGDQTGILQVARRVRTQNTSGFVYSTISDSVFSAGNTTVTLTNDPGMTLDAGLSSVAYALLSATNPSIPTIQIAQLANIPTRTTLGRVDSGSGPIQTLTAAQAALLETSKIQPVSASVATNALTLTLNPTTLDFRSATLGSGTVNTREVVSAISVVVPSGATLGTVSAVPAYLAVIAIDNAGAVELAVVNANGGFQFDESQLISTTAISAGATSASTIYSTTSRSNVPWRFVGMIDSTQATAGTWAAAPSKVQGSGVMLLSLLKARLSASGDAPIYAARAWAYVTGAGVLTAGGNIASVTKNSTGDYTLTFTTAMPNANYGAIPIGTDNGSSRSVSNIVSRATGNIRVNFVQNGSNTAMDPSNFSLVIFG